MDTPITNFLYQFFRSRLAPLPKLGGPRPTRTHARWYLEFVHRLCRRGFLDATHLIEIEMGYVRPEWYNMKWTVGTEGWIRYDVSEHRPFHSAIN